MTGVHRWTYGHGNGDPQDAGAREGRPMAGNDNEIFVDVTLESGEDSDTEGHRLATNDNEIVVERHRRVDSDDSGEMGPLGVRRK
jgi:hypothetical protein